MSVNKDKYNEEITEIKTKVGRKKGVDTKYESIVVPNLDKIVELKRKGVPDHKIAKKIKIHHVTFSKYRRKHPELDQLLIQADIEGLEEIEHTARTLALKGDVNMIKMLLTHQGGKMTAYQQKQLELQEQGKGSVQVVVNRVVDSDPED